MASPVPAIGGGGASRRLAGTDRRDKPGDFGQAMTDGARPLPIIVQADQAGIAAMMDQVRAALRQWSIPSAAAHDMLVIIDELATNIVSHAWSDGAAHSFRLELLPRADQISIVLHDDGIAFDPTQYQPTGTDLDIDERPVGGLGLALVHQLAHGIQYSRVDGENRVRIIRRY